MITPEDRARAQERSRAWKARQAELDGAIADAAEDDAKLHQAAAEQVTETYHAGWLDLVRLLILPVIVAAGALLVVERQIIEHRAANCFDVKHPQNFACAQLVAGSLWAWLLPADMAEEIRAAQNIRQ